MGKYSKKPEPRRNLKNILAGAAAGLVVAGAVLVGSSIGSRKASEPSSGVPFFPDVDQAAAQWNGIPTETKENASIAVPGYPMISIPANSTLVNLPLHNPEGNPCYFTFTLTLEDGEVLYQSKMVPPGQGIAEVTLNRALEAGEYDAVIQISTNSLVDGHAMNGANMKTVLKAG